MDDLISRQAALDAVEESRRLNHHQNGKEACAHEYEHRHFLKILRDLPPVQPERKRGKWISRKNEPKHKYWWTCSECQGRFNYEWKFCPNCGADMRGEEDE